MAWESGVVFATFAVWLHQGLLLIRRSIRPSFGCFLLTALSFFCDFAHAVSWAASDDIMPRWNARTKPMLSSEKWDKCLRLKGKINVTICLSSGRVNHYHGHCHKLLLLIISLQIFCCPIRMHNFERLARTYFLLFKFKVSKRDSPTDCIDHHNSRSGTPLLFYAAKIGTIETALLNPPRHCEEVFFSMQVPPRGSRFFTIFNRGKQPWTVS